MINKNKISIKQSQNQQMECIFNVTSREYIDETNINNNIGIVKQVNTIIRCFVIYNNITIFNNIQKDIGDF